MPLYQLSDEGTTQHQPQLLLALWKMTCESQLTNLIVTSK